MAATSRALSLTRYSNRLRNRTRRHPLKAQGWDISSDSACLRTMLEVARQAQPLQNIRWVRDMRAFELDMNHSTSRSSRDTRSQVPAPHRRGRLPGCIKQHLKPGTAWSPDHQDLSWLGISVGEKGGHFEQQNIPAPKTGTTKPPARAWSTTGHQPTAICPDRCRAPRLMERSSSAGKPNRYACIAFSV
jgi:hypothetical protein